jgi:hypothetical protein
MSNVTVMRAMSPGPSVALRVAQMEEPSASAREETTNKLIRNKRQKEAISDPFCILTSRGVCPLR